MKITIELKWVRMFIILLDNMDEGIKNEKKSEWKSKTMTNNRLPSGRWRLAKKERKRKQWQVKENNAATAKYKGKHKGKLNSEGIRKRENWTIKQSPIDLNWSREQE